MYQVDLDWSIKLMISGQVIVFSSHTESTELHQELELLWSRCCPCPQKVSILQREKHPFQKEILVTSNCVGSKTDLISSVRCPIWKEIFYYIYHYFFLACLCVCAYVVHMYECSHSHAMIQVKIRGHLSGVSLLLPPQGETKDPVLITKSELSSAHCLTNMILLFSSKELKLENFKFSIVQLSHLLWGCGCENKGSLTKAELK